MIASLKDENLPKGTELSLNEEKQHSFHKGAMIAKLKESPACAKGVGILSGKGASLVERMK